MNKIMTSPISQRLYYGERELQSHETIASLQVLNGDVIRCVEIEESGDMKDVRETAEGFGGSALVGRLSCPSCTYENEASALACEMCDHVSSIRSTLSHMH